MAAVSKNRLATLPLHAQIYIYGCTPMHGCLLLPGLATGTDSSPAVGYRWATINVNVM